MRLTPTPTALALPTMPTLQSLPTMSASGLTGAETLIYYTLSQPPPASPGLTTGLNTAGIPANSLPQINPALLNRQSVTPSLTPAMSPGVPPVSPGLTPPGLVPDIMHLINYGDKDMGLLLSQRMELVWHGEFDRLFSQYFPHMWCLVPTFYPPDDSWRTFKDSAKVRFSCQDCGHGWTSMKGRVIFWFNLNYATNAGCVMFKLYGQQCQKCKTGKFEHAMWYPEEVVKVVGNVYNRVGQIYYGFVRPPLRIDRRVGKPRNQHNSELCQACKEGLCKEEWSFT